MHITNINKLNGWQRIWLVMQLISAICLISYGFLYFPTYNSLDKIGEIKHYANRLNDAKHAEISEIEVAPCEPLRYKEYKDFENCLAGHITTKAWDTQEQKAAWLEDEENKKHTEITQIFFPIKIIFAWIGIAAISYFIGLAFAWIICGFKNNKINHH